MSDSALEPQRQYVVISQVHGPVFDENNEVQNGWTVRVRDNVSGQTVPVFVADAYYTPQNVRDAIAAKLAVVREIHTLGE